MQKQIKLKTLAAMLSLSFGTSGVVWGQDAVKVSVDEKSQAQRIVVTGSNVKRIDAETAAPLQIITKAEIQQSGAVTVKEILELSTSNDRSAITDLTGANSWASGASGASLRNLGVNATLILINGRRLPSFGFADGLQNTFVNVDAIPASAVERVEILRDGASAIYGSSAIAGVINIITRKDFNGVQVSASKQQSVNNRELGNQSFANISAGYGDINQDGYNVFASLDLYKRGNYSDDFVNRRLPEWYLKLNPSRDTGKIDSLSTGAFPGNYTGRYPSNYSDPKLAGTRISVAMPGCAAANLIDGLCRYNYWKDSDAMPGAERAALYSMGNLKISENLAVWAELQLADTKSTYNTAIPRSNVTGSSLSWYDSLKGELQYFVDPYLPVGHPNNPYSFPIGLNYRFADYPDMFKNIGGSQQYRAVAGVVGTTAGWEWDAAVGYMGGRAHQRQQLYRDRYGYYDAIVKGEYQFGQKNPRSVLDKMFPLMGSDGQSTESWLDFKASRDVMNLAGGPMTLVFGADLRHETFKHKSMDNILQARIVQYSGVSIDGARNVSAAFAELNAPITKKLELDFALRADKSGPTNLEIIPKANASYMVSDHLKLRGTMSRGYRAPSLPETGNGGASWFTGGDDPKRCEMANKIYDALMLGDATDRSNALTAYYSGCETGFPSTVTPNEKLEPERSRIYSLGFVLQASKDTSVTLDYWNVARFNEIAVRGSDYLLAHEDSQAGLVVRGALSPQDLEFGQRASQLAGVPLGFTVGPVQGVRDQYSNITQTKVAGLDFSVRSHWNLGGYGRLTTNLESTVQIDTRYFETDTQKFSENYVGYRYNPRVVSNVSANWSKDVWSLGARGYFQSARKLAWGANDTVNSIEACANRKVSAQGCQLGVDFTVDLYGSYSGFKDLRLGFNLFNLMNRQTQVENRAGGPLPLRGTALKLWGEYKF
ncbi:TonB-dependent receptor plug domain-containing protein [Undibacterium fentianense]|uniref:TonB-dependent receptor n=1 Tax=Undibacterium fentianense TaxID=2828728 RepID=A0A941E1Z7_9BURK|nr:TonB-dependent receptor [Undibacterium fentianense]MBR7799496.1 TonB-dependent receptor [Undibacterium fentianense]